MPYVEGALAACNVVKTPWPIPSLQGPSMQLVQT